MSEERQGASYGSATLVALAGGVAFGTSVAVSVGGEALSAGALRLSVFGFVFLLPFILFAYFAARRWVGFTPTPLLDALLGVAAWPPRARAYLGFAAAAALLGVGVSIPLGVLLAPPVAEDGELPLTGFENGATLVANLFVLDEEILFRLILLFPALALFGVRRADREARPTVGAWVAIVVVGVLFGAFHAPNAVVMGADFGDYLVFAIVQKGLAIGAILGFVAWRWGFEMAFVAHYGMNAMFLSIAALGM